MENDDGSFRPRLRVVDVAGLNAQSNNRSRRHPHKGQQQHVQTRPQVEPTGLRSHALGAFRAAVTLQDIADRIRLLPQTPVLQEIMLDAERHAGELHRLLSVAVYDER